jgi:peptide/nickel transport system substrate-binding protein
VPDGQDWVSFDTEGYNTTNRSAWANTEFMGIVEQAQRTYNQQERADLYRQAAEIAHEESPWVFMDHAKELRGIGPNVENFVVAPIGGPFLKQVSLSN